MAPFAHGANRTAKAGFARKKTPALDAGSIRCGSIVFAGVADAQPALFFFFAHTL